jgi:hypothetical protein
MPAQPLLFTARLKPSTTLGLRNNTIYDIISDNNGIDTAMVEALSFSASCGSLRDVDISFWSMPSESADIYNNYTELTWTAGKDITCKFGAPYLGMKDGELDCSCHPLNLRNPNI